MGLASLEAKRLLEKQRLYLLNRPEENSPTAPKNVTELLDDQLMALMGLTAQWVNYTATQLAAAEVDEKYAVAAVDKYKALSAISNRSEKTVTAAKARAYEDEQYVELTQTSQQAYAFRKMVQVMYENMERVSFFLSRELTRRIGRNDRDNRSTKWTP